MDCKKEAFLESKHVEAISARKVRTVSYSTSVEYIFFSLDYPPEAHAIFIHPPATRARFSLSRLFKNILDEV